LSSLRIFIAQSVTVSTETELAAAITHLALDALDRRPQLAAAPEAARKAKCPVIVSNTPSGNRLFVEEPQGALVRRWCVLWDLPH
jgi:hypothetical protein